MGGEDVGTVRVTSALYTLCLTYYNRKLDGTGVVGMCGADEGTWLFITNQRPPWTRHFFLHHSFLISKGV